MSRPNISRTGERLSRLAYDLEHLAARVRAAGEHDIADGVKATSRQLGNMGRELGRRTDLAGRMRQAERGRA